jgi:hypothetical protein
MKTLLSTFIILLLTFTFCDTPAQKKTEVEKPYLTDPIMIDSVSTIIIPSVYNTENYRNSIYSKVASAGDYYANLVFYDLKTDTSRKLFEKDTFIQILNLNEFLSMKQKSKNTPLKYLFYKVLNLDHNKDGVINHQDPAMLYVSDDQGNNLQPLTSKNDNVLSIQMFGQKSFLLVKLQRNADNDQNFEFEDKDYYFLKLDLKTLTFGKNIEI